MRSIVSISIFIILGLGHSASAHGVLTHQEIPSGPYTVILDASADASEIVADYSVTYDFRVQDESAQDVAYDAAYVIFSKKDGPEIFRARLDGPIGFIPGASLDVTLPDAGDYEADAIFIREKGGDETEEIALATFPLVVQRAEGARASDESLVTIALVFGLFLGLALGWFARRIFKTRS
jgi:hypothetical protein